MSAALSLVVAGVMFVLYPVFRPWADESTVDGATVALSSDAWVASHAFAMVGFILVTLGLLGVARVLGAPLARAAVVTSVVGSGLVLPYYGAEDFGLHAIASDPAGRDLLALMEAVRYQPVAVTMFGVGLLTLAASGVLTALGVARSGRLPRWSGVPFALGYVLFLPQFFTPAAVRIGHGIVLGVGLAWLGIALARAARGPVTPSPTSPAVNAGAH